MTTHTSTRWGVVLAIWAAGLGVAAQYGKISVIFDRLPELYPAAGASISFSVSLVGAMGILLGLVAGVFVASFGFRRTMVWSLWIGALMSGLQALHLPFGMFLLTRVVEGLSHLGVVVAGPVLIAQVSSNRDRGLTMTIWSTFFGVAFALLTWFGLPLTGAFGPLSLFVVHAGLMAALALILTGALRSLEMPTRSRFPNFAALLRMHFPVYCSAWKVAPAAGWLFYTCCFVALLTVLPPYLAPDIRSFVMGAMPLASITTSMTLGVFLLRKISAVLVVEIGFLLSALMVWWLWVLPGNPVVCIALASAMGLVQGGSFSAIAQLNLEEVSRAQASGVLAQAGNMGNTIGTPLMVATLSFAGFSGLMGVLMTLFLAGFLVHLLLTLRRGGLGAQ